eukprot:m.335821 g.335821  ORF g.335821 m.335821 type:complete len:435 (+) comp17685_c0_seq1:121-1425(+)
MMISENSSNKPPRSSKVKTSDIRGKMRYIAYGVVGLFALVGLRCISQDYGKLLAYQQVEAEAKAESKTQEVPKFNVKPPPPPPRKHNPLRQEKMGSYKRQFDFQNLVPMDYLPAPPNLKWPEADFDRFTPEKKLELLRQGCGEVCDRTMRGKPSLYFNFIEKKVNCKALWANHIIDIPRTLGPAPLMEPAMKKAFLYHGAVPLEYHVKWPINQQRLSTDDTTSKQAWEWSHENIEKEKQMCIEGTLKGTYSETQTAMMLNGLKMAPRVAGGHVLVVGSVSPWVEACALAAGAAKITTLEYGVLNSTHPKVNTITPDEARKAYLAGTFPEFDAIVSFSSIEHSGLGRYGDSLNPYGDVQQMARLWCTTKQGGNLVLGTEMERQGQDEAMMWNAHRRYGNIMYPHLVANFQQLAHAGGPVYVFTKHEAEGLDISNQ